MALGHRCNNRHHVTLNAIAINPDGLTHTVQIKNISQDGLFLSSPQLQVPPFNLLELDIELQGGHYHLKSMVVHNSNRGMGVMFYQPQTELLQQVEKAFGKQELADQSSLASLVSAFPEAIEAG